MAELAEKIKALRAANTVEAAPERVVRKAVRAERPVTARIRERGGRACRGRAGNGESRRRSEEEEPWNRPRLLLRCLPTRAFEGPKR